MSITNLHYDGKMWYTYDEVCDKCSDVIYCKDEFKQTTNPLKDAFYMQHGSICFGCLRKRVDDMRNIHNQ